MEPDLSAGGAPGVGGRTGRFLALNQPKWRVNRTTAAAQGLQWAVRVDREWQRRAG